MAIYDYECTDCSMIFEVKRNLDDKSEVKCPGCKGKVRQIFSPTAIIFRGQSFYTTDIRQGGLGYQACDDTATIST